MSYFGFSPNASGSFFSQSVLNSMLWDPEVESPASIAIIGAGPVGIEAALYARFLGYNVDIYDIGRPARAATRWNQRSIEVAIAGCTTSLGHAALSAQSENYHRPDANIIWTGQQFADEYITPVAKSDLLHDFVHINSPVIEVGRYRSSLEQLPTNFISCNALDSTLLNEAGATACRESLQERCNDEFRLLVRSRDRGDYTARADIVIDCRGPMSSLCNWGPSGSQAIGASQVQAFIFPWLPCDTRFEKRMVEGKRILLFGQSDVAKRFAREWIDLCRSYDGELNLIWIIPSVTEESDLSVRQLAEDLAKEVPNPKCLSSVFTLGVDRIQRNDAGHWRLELLQSDDSTIEITGDLFAPFPNFRPTTMIGAELLPQTILSESSYSNHHRVVDGNESYQKAANLFHAEYPGWKVATREPHYYKLGSLLHPHHAQGLIECYNQIRDLFALLGGRSDLDLYRHFDLQA
jgi:2-polyprenyl-6-methoxyphenol hydroxylase-like FAD-dependent oxidoreductase